MTLPSGTGPGYAFAHRGDDGWSVIDGVHVATADVRYLIEPGGVIVCDDHVLAAEDDALERTGRARRTVLPPPVAPATPVLCAHCTAVVPARPTAPAYDARPALAPATLSTPERTRPAPGAHRILPDPLVLPQLQHAVPDAHGTGVYGNVDGDHEADHEGDFDDLDDAAWDDTDDWDELDDIAEDTDRG